MVFFVLSGYVIGRTNPEAIEPKDVGGYARKRLVRLVPINIVGVLLACIATTNPSVLTAIQNLFFLGNCVPYAGLSISVIGGNENLWSLNYEMLYYTLFIAVWLLRPQLKFVLVLTAMVAFIGWYTSLLPIFVACYAAGYIFWLSGLAIAWHGKPSMVEVVNWPSCLMLLIVTWKLRTLLNVLAGFPVPLFDGPVVRPYYLDFLPVCLWLFAIVSRRTIPGLRWIKLASVLIPAVGLAIKWKHPGYFTPFDYRMAMGSYLGALMLWNLKLSLQYFRFFAPVGSIAFALYAVARPIQAIVFDQSQWLPSNHLGYWVAATITAITCLFLAILLERVIQPELVRRFRGN